MRHFGVALAAVAVFLTASSAASPNPVRIVWDGLFQTGFSSWTGVQARAGGATVVPAPGRPGNAARFLVRPGDVPIGGTGERAEVFKETGESSGIESFWAWSVYFPLDSSSAPNSDWNVFTQWHQTETHGVQPLSFEISNDQGREWIRLRSWGGDAVSPTRRAWRLAPLVRGRWYDFALRVRWAPDLTGLLQVWLDKKQVLPTTRTPTLYFGESVYLKQGFYRSPSAVTSEVYIAGTRRVESLGDLEISQAAAAAPVEIQPRNQRAPVIKGVVGPRQLLTATKGRWSHAPTRFGYQWQSSRDGTSWENIRRANRPSLVLPAGFSASYVRVRVAAANAAGLSVAMSSPLGRRVVNKAATPSTSMLIAQNIRQGQTLSGTIVWRVWPTSPVKMVVFAMDSNRVTYIDASPPYEYVVDTTKLADGEHTFGLTVTRLNGSIVWKPYQIGKVMIDNRNG